ncbi:hypothetical protein TBLA_0B03820 [Henningerozyma blattae CBS 6284]|uniref:Uncharacterized protein n=1 Tax=Henningerozyma blattae (strain ATCC 34711 / CBS 6284 / DSM 70876 / NBRC 10599 / NRRL Y-10934 / UCD 77-7) TaxID=1071380 RepID=I2GYL9_HENB6|nr:hypothetical protein TBLA_0B03820 [Tetrapisispora blattae CBS 6284]CCH59221.1 hypothetical protein TBLA_0B03820 [Tetrapisispora blattae CBS 6284]
MMMMKKQDRKLNRSYTLTLMIVSILSFLYLSYNYDDFFYLNNNSNNKSTTINDDIKLNHDRIHSELNLLTEDNFVHTQEEPVLNSIKVEEQISTILNDITNHHPTKLPVDDIPSSTRDPNPTGSYNPELNFKQILNTSPMVLFIRSSQKSSKFIKKLFLNEYEISPEFAIVDLDLHKNGNILQNYIQTKKIINKDDTLDVPYLFINGVSVINSNLNKDIISLHVNDLLLDKLKSLAGDNVMFQKKGVPSNN